jgi:hypothetical protein
MSTSIKELPENKSAAISLIISDAVEANLIKLDDKSTTSRRYAKYLSRIISF